MKINSLLMILLCMGVSLRAMEESPTASLSPKQNDNVPLESLLVGFPSLKLKTAIQLAASDKPITVADVGEQDLADLITQIRNIQACATCSDLEKQLFINLINNPAIDIENNFPDLVIFYLRGKNYTGKQQILNAILLKVLFAHYLSMAQLAVDYGADVNMKEGNPLWLELAQSVGRLDPIVRTEIAQWLVEHGANIDIQDQKGITGLMASIASGNTPIIYFLLTHGANVNIADQNGNTALFIAIDQYEPVIVSSLLDKGADTNAQNKQGNTPLMWAARDHFGEAAEMLLKKGAKVNAQNSDGNTALMDAVKRKRGRQIDKKLVQQLLDNGADVTMVNNAGDSALTIAERGDNNKVLEMLRERETITSESL